MTNFINASTFSNPSYIPIQQNGPQPIHMSSISASSYLVSNNSMLISPVNLQIAPPTPVQPQLPVPVVQPMQIVCPPPLYPNSIRAPTTSTAILDLNQLPSHMSVSVTNYPLLKHDTASQNGFVPVNNFKSQSSQNFSYAAKSESLPIASGTNGVQNVMFASHDLNYQSIRTENIYPTSQAPAVTSSQSLNVSAFEFHPRAKIATKLPDSNVPQSVQATYSSATSRSTSSDLYKGESASTPSDKSPNSPTTNDPILNSYSSRATPESPIEVAPQDEESVLNSFRKKGRNRIPSQSRLASVYKSPPKAKKPPTKVENPLKETSVRNKRSDRSQIRSPKSKSKSSNSPHLSQKKPDRSPAVQDRSSKGWKSIEPLEDCDIEFTEPSFVFEMPSSYNPSEDKVLRRTPYNDDNLTTGSPKEKKPSETQTAKLTSPQGPRKPTEMTLNSTRNKKSTPQTPEVVKRSKLKSDAKSFHPKTNRSSSSKLKPTASEFIPNPRRNSDSGSRLKTNADEFVPQAKRNSLNIDALPFECGPNFNPYAAEFVPTLPIPEAVDPYEVYPDVFDMTESYEVSAEYPQEELFDDAQIYCESYEQPVTIFYDGDIMSEGFENLSIDLYSPNCSDEIDITSPAADMASPDSSADTSKYPMAPLEQRGGAFYFDPDIQLDRRQRLRRKPPSVLPITEPPEKDS